MERQVWPTDDFCAKNFTLEKKKQNQQNQRSLVSHIHRYTFTHLFVYIHAYMYLSIYLSVHLLWKIEKLNENTAA